MSQQTMSQLASLASRPDPAADTLAHYQALPVAHHQLEQGGGGMLMHFFCIFLHIQEPLIFCIFCIFLHFFAYVLPSVSF